VKDEPRSSFPSVGMFIYPMKLNIRLRPAPTYRLVQIVKICNIIDSTVFAFLITMVLSKIPEDVPFQRFPGPKIPKTTDGDVQIALFWPVVL